MTKYTKKKQTMREKKLAMQRWLLGTSFRIGISVFVLFFGFVYVIQLSSVSTKGYDINDLQKQVNQLQRENRKMNVEISKYRSMQSIQERLSNTDLVAVDKVTYKNIIGTVVARR